MRSHNMTKGLEKAPHRSLLHALGLTRTEIERPLIGVVNAANEVVPGHMHLDRIAEAVKAGVRAAGGGRAGGKGTARGRAGTRRQPGTTRAGPYAGSRSAA